MNSMVLNIAEVIKTTCKVHRIAMSEKEINELAVNAWLQAGGDKEKLIDYLQTVMRPQ